MAWDPAKHPRGPNGRFVKVGAALSAAGKGDRQDLASAVLGTASAGPKRLPSDRERFGVAGRKWSAAALQAKADQDARVAAATQERMRAEAAITARELERYGAPQPAKGRKTRRAVTSDDFMAMQNAIGPTAGSRRDLEQRQLAAQRANNNALRDQLIAALRSASSREAGQQALAGLTAAQLRDVAAAAGVPAAMRGRKSDLIARIIERTIGARINSAAVRGL